MMYLKTVGLTALALALSAGLAMAETYTKGKIKKVDAKAGKVTIIHEELVDLDMPAMTMVFRANEEMIVNMAEGQDIEFVAARVDGKLTVIALK
ncbi:copper-binding protein [Antarcticimicrobium luteum]|uniref:copper-binding protein n=1 Tax=Antarcticimicrobium luteum TaxID=2547397 RepID=UPI0026ACAF33